jgi:hypothetical protein
MRMIDVDLDKTALRIRCDESVALFQSNVEKYIVGGAKSNGVLIFSALRRGKARLKRADSSTKFTTKFGDTPYLWLRHCRSDRLESVYGNGIWFTIAVDSNSLVLDQPSNCFINGLQ